MRFTLIYTAALFLLNCSVQVADKTVGSETTNGFAGMVKDGNSPEPEAEVGLYSLNYSPIDKTDDSQFSRVTETDEKGEYLIENLKEGEYNIIARSGDGRRAVLIRNISLDDKEALIDLPDAELQKTGTISISLSKRTVEAGAHFYIPGTDVYAKTASDDISLGMVELKNVPAGSYSSIIYTDAGETDGENILGRSVEVTAGEFVIIGQYAAWSNAAKLFINTTAEGAGVAGEVVNAPILIRLIDADFDFTQAQPDGSDLRFTKSDGLTELPYEIERWDAENRQAEIWVKTDTVYGSNDKQFIFMYTGQSDAPASGSGSAVFETADGFAGVWHLNGTNFTEDATGYGNNGTDKATAPAQGVIGGARSFDRSDKAFIQVPWHTAMEFGTGDFTLSAIVKYDSSYDKQQIIFREICEVQLRKDSLGVMRLQGYAANKNANYEPLWSEDSVPAGSWVHAVFRRTAGDIQLFINGEPASEAMTVLKDVNSPSDLYIGHNPGLIEYYGGIIDEVRIAGIGRSDEWIKLCYENQRMNSTVVRIE